MSEKNTTLKDPFNSLKEKGINPSFQRLKIYEYLNNHRNHPTVDIIYKDMIDEIPTLSRTTVYNTLHLFYKHGLITEITIEENEVRYDIITEPHAHFKCIKCKSLYDIDLDCSIFDRKHIDGHNVTECHVYLRGLCKDCQ